MEPKVCSKCGIRKATSEFYKDKRSEDGLRSDCKLCCRSYYKRWRGKNKTKVLTYQRAWHKQNKNHIADYRKHYRKNNKDKMDQYKKEYYVKITFGLSLEEYDTIKQELFEKQNGRCAICGVSASEYKRGLDLDHNHETGQIRGLLCVTCNTRLAHLEDIQFVINAKAYLAKHE